ncbi:hypothetical protein [Candidatus Berkiella aquae]|uniref:Uncharacterized protein n=1 Tax=Candidatus Berkiella aquae TaxID=295108 RepID=A0A0Q9Z0B9_9GAMM|nr:hypothetical protein [Candidatus Berkiella aquae]MCS5710366.1 hypothetical protein [Candidatus Berkiella aquae]
MWLSHHQKIRKWLIDIVIISMAVMLLVYPLEVSARELVRIQHGAQSGSGFSGGSSVSDSYNASRQEQARRDAQNRVQDANDALENARTNELYIRGQGPNSISPNQHYQDMMDAQRAVDNAEQNLREEDSRAYWDARH